MGVYYLSEDYRNFLYNLKYEEPSKIATDEYVIETQTDESLAQELASSNSITTNSPQWDIIQPEIFSQEGELQTVELDNTSVQNINLSMIEEDVLEAFMPQYNLQKWDAEGSLFDVTTEYPDKYFEYIGQNIVLYFFPTKTYKQVKDIMYVESDWSIFALNETTKLWEAMFFINLNVAYDDNNVRMVVLHKWKTFWLKILKNEYNAVKEIIKQL